MRSFLLAVLLTILPLASSFAQRLNIIEINIQSYVLYNLYHYEPKLLMCQIYGSPNFSELGYSVGPYWSNKSILIEMPLGVNFTTSVPIEQKFWHTKLNFFAAFPSFDNPKLEITSINDFAWGVDGISDRFYNKFEILYGPYINAGLRMYSINIDREKFSPYIGIVKRIPVNESISFVLYQGRKVNKSEWLIELDIFFKYIPK